SDIPRGINLVGATNGIADARGQFTITLRDLANNPLPGSYVVIDFSPCASDIRLCSAQSSAGANINCTGDPGMIGATTDRAGTVTLRIVGGARNVAPGTPGAGFRCATIYADGVVLGSVNV